MDIFFCDLCGARVSDADLRAGHGTRRRWDVICGACLEQGHGQEWLSQRAGMKPGVAAAVAAAVPAGPPPSASAAVLDAPRDRARTIEEDEEPPSRIAARSVQRDDTDAPTPFVREDHEITTRVPQPGQTEPQLSSAAGAFARLAEEAKPEPAIRDDLDDVSEDLPGAGMTPTPAPAVSPFAFDSRKDTDEDPKPGTATRASRTPSASTRKGSPSGTRAAPAKAGGAKSTSGRMSKSGRRAAPDSSRKILMITAISAAVLILGIIGVLLMGPKKGAAKIIKEDPGKELVAKVDSTRTMVLDALRSPNDVPKLTAARDRLKSVQGEIYSFEDLVEKKYGWSEEQVGEYVRTRLHWADLQSQLKTLNDYIERSKH